MLYMLKKIQVNVGKKRIKDGNMIYKIHWNLRVYDYTISWKKEISPMNMSDIGPWPGPQAAVSSLRKGQQCKI